MYRPCHEINLQDFANLWRCNVFSHMYPTDILQIFKPSQMGEREGHNLQLRIYFVGPRLNMLDSESSDVLSNILFVALSEVVTSCLHTVVTLQLNICGKNNNSHDWTGFGDNVKYLTDLQTHNILK